MKAFASDLDQTLIYSRRWLADLKHKSHDVVCVEHYKNKSASFMLKEAAETLRGIDRAHHFIPITTRTVAQYNRIPI